MGKTKKAPKTISIQGARANNLKNVNIDLPKNKLIVVTGVSGSGKSSLIMDTLYAEGQRRYVESLSSYARQFLSRMKKPDVDYIKGICPAIAIEQKTSSSNARSTVGTLTEIYDYLRLLYSRIGKTISPVSGKTVKKETVTDVIDYIKTLDESQRLELLIQLDKTHEERDIKTVLNILQQKGYARIQYKNKNHFLEDIIEKTPKWCVDKNREKIYLVIDRFTANKEEENIKRIADSVLTAFYESGGDCLVKLESGKLKNFNNRFSLDGIEFIEPSHQLFNFNNPYGACPSCEGYGRILGIDPEKVIPNDNLSLYEGAIYPWRGERGNYYLSQVLKSAEISEIPIHTPYCDLDSEAKEMIWYGNQYFEGIFEYFEELESKAYKIQNRVILARYRGRTVCSTCQGGRLRKESKYVKIQEKSIDELIELPIDELSVFFEKLKLNNHDKDVAKRILLEINNRLETMENVGLGYLTLNRISSTLSGGETQRINLTRTLGSNLTNSLYILDEPSIGLHPKDTTKLMSVLKNLKDLSNTVIVVEHEEEIIRNADCIVDVGPGAGIHGGTIIFNDTYEAFEKESPANSLTANYLFNQKTIKTPTIRRQSSNKIQIIGARQHNLKNIDVTIPLNALTVISGVSGSGKSTLVNHILGPAIKRHLNIPFRQKLGKFKEIIGDLNQINKIEMIDQHPIGRSSRSNPVTYVKAYDPIRKLYSDQQLSKIRGFKPKHFSFNVDGGRCDNCEGDGNITVEMQFLADVKLVCEDCRGRRFKSTVLDVKYNDKSIFDVLSMSVEEAIEFFSEIPEIQKKLLPLNEVGLGYITLGQASNTLSGGEAQRVKLASYLGVKSPDERIFFIFDEPTTGLHFDDINKLLKALNDLVEKGHSVVVVEHNLDVINAADWLIDLGPEGGVHGGNLVFQGTPEEIVKDKKSFTGFYLKEKMSHSNG